MAWGVEPGPCQQRLRGREKNPGPGPKAGGVGQPGRETRRRTRARSPGKGPKRGAATPTYARPAFGPAAPRSPSTTPHRNLRAPPAAPATAAPPAPLGCSSPGAGAAGGSNAAAPEGAAGLACSSLSRSSSAAWLSFCTILRLPAVAVAVAAATSAAWSSSATVRRAAGPEPGRGAREAPAERARRVAPSALPPPARACTRSAGTRMPRGPDVEMRSAGKGGGTGASPLSAAAAATTTTNPGRAPQRRLRVVAGPRPGEAEGRRPFSPVSAESLLFALPGLSTASP